MNSSTEIIKDKPKMPVGRPRRYKTVREMTMGISKYLKNTIAPTKAGLAYELGFVSKDALNYYGNNPEFSDLIKQTFLFIERFWTERLLHPACTGSIFWLKNNAGYADKQEIRTETVLLVAPVDVPAVEAAAQAYKRFLAPMTKVIESKVIDNKEIENV